MRLDSEHTLLSDRVSLKRKILLLLLILLYFMCVFFVCFKSGWGSRTIVVTIHFNCVTISVQ